MAAFNEVVAGFLLALGAGSIIWLAVVGMLYLLLRNYKPKGDDNER